MSSKPTLGEKLLEVKDLVVHYGKTEALKGILVDIPKEMIVALVGANGAGKSTLLRVISGLMKPTSGEVWFEGIKIDRVPAHKIAKLGIAHVPEGRRLFMKMSVLDNLKIGSRNSCRLCDHLDRDSRGEEPYTVSQ